MTYDRYRQASDPGGNWLLWLLVGLVGIAIWLAASVVDAQVVHHTGPCVGGYCPLPRRPAPQVVTAPQVTIDYGRLLNMMAADPRFKGPPGRPGQPGRPGVDGNTPHFDVDELVDRVVARLAQRAAAVDEAELAKRITPHLPPIAIETYSSDGRFEGRAERRLGGQPFYFGRRPRQ